MFRRAMLGSGLLVMTATACATQQPQVADARGAAPGTSAEPANPPASHPPPEATSVASPARTQQESLVLPPVCPVEYDTDVVVAATDTDGGIALDFKGEHRDALRKQVEGLGDAYESASEGHAVGSASSASQHEAAPGSSEPADLVRTQVNYEPTPGGARLEFVPRDLRDVEYLRAVIRNDALAMSTENRCPRFDE